VSDPTLDQVEWLGATRRLVARVRGPLSAKEHRALFRAAVAERKYFVQASTGGAEDYREAQVHYTCVDEADVLVAKVRALGPSIAAGLGVALENVTRVERQLTVHLDGGFYRPHRDNQGEEAARRALTFVYYFRAPRARGPSPFSGGELVIEDGERCLVAPEDNTLVLFDAGLLHEVQPVTSPRPLAFEEGRFTINGWLWR
jgi:SM-20-related protein